MDREFFSSIDDRRDAYAKRAGVDAAEVQIAFHGGRTLAVDRVVEMTDTWLMVEGRDKLDEETPVALATPYHQIASVQFVPHRERMGKAGF